MKLGAFATAALLGLCATAARAQDWYDAECCPFTDCRAADPGEVRLVEGGYYIAALGLTVRSSDPRVMPSHDDGYHLCLHATAIPELEISAWYLQMNHRVLKCLYVPAMS